MHLTARFSTPTGRLRLWGIISGADLERRTTAKFKGITADRQSDHHGAPMGERIADEHRTTQDGDERGITAVSHFSRGEFEKLIFGAGG